MTEKNELLQQEDVIRLKEDNTKWIMSHTTFTVSDFTSKLLESYTTNKKCKKWSTNGLEADVMSSNKSWQNGKVRLSIEFISSELSEKKETIQEKKNIEHLKQDDVIQLKSSDSEWIIPHITFTVRDFTSKLLESYTDSEELKKWSTNSVDADVMTSGKSWQNGKVRLTIEFIPNVNEDKFIELEQYKDLSDDIELNLKELTKKLALLIFGMIRIYWKLLNY